MMNNTVKLAASILILLIGITEFSCTSSGIIISEKHSPVPASAHILLYSDIGYANEGQSLVTEAMTRRHAEYPFDFAVSAGDNIQLKPKIFGSTSMINLWGDGGLKEAFELPFAPLIQDGIRFYAALGNHDHQGFRYFIERNYSDNVNTETINTGGFFLPASDYTVQRNGVKIVFLDIATAFSNLNWSEQRAEFARRELSSNKEKWIILVIHYPLWSSGEHGHDKALIQLREVMLPILNGYPVDFIISGHDHHAELFYYQGKIKTRIAIIGNTARPHELPFEPEIPSIFRTNTRGFTELDIQDDKAVLSFRSIEGTIMFSDEVQK